MAQLFLELVAAGFLAWLVFEIGRALWRRSRAVAVKAERAREAAAKVEEALALPGATPERAVEVVSASVIEAQAAAQPCPICEHGMRVESHTVDTTLAEEPLRVVVLTCKRCGHRRRWYARVRGAQAH